MDPRHEVIATGGADLHMVCATHRACGSPETVMHRPGAQHSALSVPVHSPPSGTQHPPPWHANPPQQSEFSEHGARGDASGGQAFRLAAPPASCVAAASPHADASSRGDDP
jgi:hypothetical protein